MGALRVVEEVLARQTHHLEALRLRGEVLVCLERHAEAAENQRRIDQDPGEIPALLQQGQVFQAVEKMAQMGTNHPAFRACLGRLIAQLDQHLDPHDGVPKPQPGEDSLQHWFAFAVRRLIHHSPDAVYMHIILGHLLYELGQLHESELEYRTVLRHDLNHLEALMALGKLCLQKGQLRDALLAYKKLMNLKPGPYVEEQIGRIHFQTGLIQDAVRDWLNSAEGYRKQAKDPDAVRVLQLVLQADKGNPSALQALRELGAPLPPGAG